MNKPSNLLVLLLFFYKILFNNLSSKSDVIIKNESKYNKYFERNDAIELMIGSFHPGPYAPYELKTNSWRSCNSMTLCSKSGIYGNLIGLRYIKGINIKNTYLDYSLIYGSNSPIIKNNKIYSYKGGQNKNFFLFSIVPTYRKYFNGSLKNFNIGIGGGINMAINKIPTEVNSNQNINSQVNLEIGYNLSNKSKTDLIFNLQHRCTFFGAIGGKMRGRQWYTIGLRKWI